MVDIEKLDSLPHKLPMKMEECKDGKRFRQIYTNHYWGKRSNKNPYVIAERLINHYIGRTFDEAFAHFCLKVEQRYQHYFKEHFVNFNDRIYHRWEYFFVDENGFIQKKNTREKKIIFIQSSDYKTELRHKVTGDKITQFEEIYKKVERIGKYGYFKGKIQILREFSHLEYGANPYKLLPIGLRYRAQKTDFIPVCISGFIKYFESKKDPQYKRLMAEYIKNSKKEWNKKYKKPKLSDIEYRAILRAKVLKDREETKIKLEAKGMRPNAFTNHL